MWRYVATRLKGDGTETPLAYDIPVQGLSFREDLSGPGALNGTITPEIPRLKQDEWFIPRSTAIYAEADGVIRFGGILVDRTEAGPDLQLGCVGFTGFAKGEPYKGERSSVYADPLDEFRHIWGHIQAQEGKNLGIVWDGVTSDLTVGTAEEPYKLNFWSTLDLGGELDKLAAVFDYGMKHSWDGDTIRHEGLLGYPRIGRRLDNRFVVGENIFEVPTIGYHGDAYASEVIVLGAGEGRKMRRGTAQRNTGRLGRTVTISDDSLTSDVECKERAELELKLRLGDPDITSLVLLNHPHAPVGSVSPGDELLVQTRDGWNDGLDLWVRVLAKTTAPDDDRTVLDVTRVERV